MVKIFTIILVLVFITPAFAEVVEVPPVREAPSEIEKVLGSNSANTGKWVNQPAARQRTTKPQRSVCPSPQNYPAPPPQATEIYGDPTRGFVQNRSNFFIRGYWANQNGNGKPGSQPAFELAPGFIWEGSIQPGGYKWLYVEAMVATGAGAAPVGWKTFEIQPQNQPLIWGWYGWAVYVDSGYFPYFTGGKLP